MLSVIIYLVAIIWIYQDALKLRRKGVSIYPGLVVGLIILGGYLFAWVSLFGFFRVPYGFRMASYYIQGLIPLIVYLILRFTKYKKLSLLGTPPLPPAPRWAFWFMIATILAPLIILGFIAFTFFRGW